MNSQLNTTPERSKSTDDTSQLAIIALGANLPSPLGAPEQTIRAALAELQELGPLQSSKLLTSEPEDCPPGSPDFVNAIALVAVDADLHPRHLLEYLQMMEERFGRERHSGQALNAPRTLDLDLISLGSWVLNEPELTLPHPRAAQRRFVLEPLHELLPNYVLPGSNVTVHELLLQVAS